ncbi:hypothetical protein OSTOST_21023, partial [Ostertagia ostertagi]
STDTISYKSAPTDDVQVVPCVIRKKPRFAPKILKKKSSLNKVSKEPNVKHVTFEVEQLLSREGNIQDRSAARERLVRPNDAMQRVNTIYVQSVYWADAFLLQRL